MKYRTVTVHTTNADHSAFVGEVHAEGTQGVIVDGWWCCTVGEVDKARSGQMSKPAIRVYFPVASIFYIQEALATPEADHA